MNGIAKYFVEKREEVQVHINAIKDIIDEIKSMAESDGVEYDETTPKILLDQFTQHL